MYNNNPEFKRYSVLKTLIFTGMVAGCSGSDDASDAEALSGDALTGNEELLLSDVAEQGNSGSGEQAQNATSPFGGTWESGCFQLDTEFDSFSEESIVITADTVSYSFLIHDAADCSDAPILLESGILAGSYIELQDITTSEGLMAREVELTVATTTLIDGTVMQGSIVSKIEMRPTSLNLDLPFTRQ